MAQPPRKRGGKVAKQRAKQPARGKAAAPRRALTPKQAALEKALAKAGLGRGPEPRPHAGTAIDKITIQYSAPDGRTWEVELDGNDTWALFTNRELAHAFGKLINQKPKGKPANARGPRRIKGGGGGKQRRSLSASTAAADTGNGDGDDEPPENCYYVNGIWYCW